MARFLHKYVHEPVQALLAEVPKTLPEIILRMDADRVTIIVGGETFSAKRSAVAALADETEDEIPEDADEQIT